MPLNGWRDDAMVVRGAQGSAPIDGVGVLGEREGQTPLGGARGSDPIGGVGVVE